MKLTHVLVLVLAVFLVVGCTPKTPKKAATDTQAPAAPTVVKETPAKAEPQPKVQAPAEVWTCTMHPEVRESKPGKCPKCGMDLVKVQALNLAPAAPAPAAAPPAPAAAPPAPAVAPPAPAAAPPAPAAVPPAPAAVPPAPAPAPAAK